MTVAWHRGLQESAGPVGGRVWLALHGPLLFLAAGPEPWAPILDKIYRNSIILDNPPFGSETFLDWSGMCWQRSEELQISNCPCARYAFMRVADMSASIPVHKHCADLS